MAGTKRRKEPVQASTLHDFFASYPIKKTKSASSTVPKPETRSVTHDEIQPEDIIVISDDEPATDGESGTDKDTSTHNLVPFSSESRDFESSLFGDWEMGDDEGGICEEGDDEHEHEQEQEQDTHTKSEKTKVQFCQNQYPEVDNACPICGQSLNGFLEQVEIDRHVNSCLDALSGSGPSSHSKAEFTEPRALPIVQPTNSSTSSKPISAFSILMSSHRENDAWKEASEAENKRGNVKGRRPAPFYKVMQGMPIAVDAFRYGKIPGVTAYFLTHAHSDHYTNLSSSWKHGPIYCSQTTANLIIHMLTIDPKWVHPLPMDTPTVIPETGNVDVTLIQANHCPGSVLFLFKGRQTVNAGDSTILSPHVGSQRIFRYLHCGDFRACPQHVLHPEVKGNKIDIVYLDTTYLNPKYCFPPQPLVISACAELALRVVKGNAAPGQCDDENPGKDQSILTGWLTSSAKGKEKSTGCDNLRQERILVVVGTYTIGKERIVKAIARALSTKIYCDTRKAAVFKCLSDPELHAMLTSDPFSAGVHVVPLHVINSNTFKDYLSKWHGYWTRAVGFRPTGWTYAPIRGTNTLPSISHVITRDQARVFTHTHLRPMRNSTPTLMLYGVPYSEHSSFFELTCFALSLDWTKMVATVNVGSLNSRVKMAKWFERWQAERNRREMSGGEDVVSYRQLDYW